MCQRARKHALRIPRPSTQVAVEEKKKQTPAESFSWALGGSTNSKQLVLHCGNDVAVQLPAMSGLFPGS